jgi:hypothetical protein
VAPPLKTYGHGTPCLQAPTLSEQQDVNPGAGERVPLDKSALDVISALCPPRRTQGKLHEESPVGRKRPEGSRRHSERSEESAFCWGARPFEFKGGCLGAVRKRDACTAHREPTRSSKREIQSRPTPPKIEATRHPQSLQALTRVTWRRRPPAIPCESHQRACSRQCLRSK